MKQIKPKQNVCACTAAKLLLTVGRQQNPEHGTFRNIPEHSGTSRNIPEHPGTGQIITK